MTQSEPLQTAEKKVKKKDAIWFYLDVWKKVEDRIQAINGSSNEAEFVINEDLISNF
jgi:hypothetical protein